MSSALSEESGNEYLTLYWHVGTHVVHLNQAEVTLWSVAINTIPVELLNLQPINRLLLRVYVLTWADPGGRPRGPWPPQLDKVPSFPK